MVKPRKSREERRLELELNLIYLHYKMDSSVLQSKFTLMSSHSKTFYNNTNVKARTNHIALNK